MPMTEVREPNYSVDLPGEWGVEAGPEESSTLFFETDGPGMLSVMLLGVRPMFAIADEARLLDDYMSHRATYETPANSVTSVSEPESSQVGEAFVGTWSSYDPELLRQVRHHVVLVKGLLVDFTFEATALSEDEFDKRAAQIFASVTVTGPDAAEAPEEG